MSLMQWMYYTNIGSDSHHTVVDIIRYYEEYTHLLMADNARSYKKLILSRINVFKIHFPFIKYIMQLSFYFWKKQ